MRTEATQTVVRLNGVDTGHFPKSELIKTVLTDESSFACYGTSERGVCGQAYCLWRDDCFDAAHQQGELS